MDRKKKIIIIGGTVIAAVVITVVSISNSKVDKTLQRETDQTYVAESSLLSDEAMVNDDISNITEFAATLDSVDTMISDDTTSSDNIMSSMETWEVTDAIISEIEDVVTKYYSTEELSEDVIVADTAKKQEKVKKEITEKRSGIEAYKDIKVIVRKGLEKDTFVAFASYKTKFLNIDTLAPGMSVLYIVTNEEGKLGIQETPEDEKLAEHINQLLKEEEIASLVDNVNSGFAKALEKDDNLKTLVEKLTKKSE